jgi:hypothetical protein
MRKAAPIDEWRRIAEKIEERRRPACPDRGHKEDRCQDIG